MSRTYAVSGVADRLRANRPRLHAAGSSSFGLGWPALSWLERILTAEMTTLETGCGISTVVFAASGARHTVVAPDSDEWQRVCSYCSAEQIETGRIRFLEGPSDVVISRDWTPEPLDLVLIDGAHGFPYPVLDWYLLASNVRLGGRVVLDDAWIPSVNLVFRYLKSTRAWNHEATIGRETVSFVKLAETPPSYDWNESRFDQIPRLNYLPLHRRPWVGLRLLVDRLGLGPAIASRLRR